MTGDLPEYLENFPCVGVVIPGYFSENIQEFRSVLETYRFASHIHTVMKVNTSPVLLRTARSSGCRVDVSSLGELQKALLVGYSGEEIIANGPKNEAFLRACIDADVTIIFDSISEIRMLGKMLESSGKQQRVLIRLSGFSGLRATRFGVLREYWSDSLESLVQYRESFRVLGYSFHLDTRDVSLRKSAFWESVEYMKLLKKNGFRISVIDIGGGYGVEYQDDAITDSSVCQRFHLGSRMYPGSDGPVGSRFLQVFLSDTGEKGVSIGVFLEENLLELWIEPGRSLMKNVGYVATRVISVRIDSLVLDTNSFSLGMREEELPTDPILYPRENEKGAGIHEYMLLGNLCLESDIFFSRYIRFSREARIGDIVIFPDVGAYHMDFYETESISHPKKFRLFQENDKLFTDSFY